MTLTWEEPATDFDGAPLTGLSGYKVYFGTESGKYSNVIDVGKTTAYQLTNLTCGSTYYFSVTAYNSSGGESDFSNEVSKTIK